MAGETPGLIFLVMATIKHITINSFHIDDTNALFNEMCKEIAHESAFKVKREILKMTDGEKTLSKYKANILDIIKFVEAYDVPVTIKVNYAASKNFEETRAEKHFMPNPNEGFQDDKFLEDINNQAKEITNPDLVDDIPVILSNVVTEEKNDIVEQRINPDDIPDFNIGF